MYDLLNSNSGKPLTPGRKRNKVRKCDPTTSECIIVSKSTMLQLRVREHQVLGPYVEDLSTYVASSYADIEVSTSADSVVFTPNFHFSTG